MFFYLFLLFTLVPLVELILLVRIYQATSFLFTVALVLATGILGAALARWQGWRTLRRIQSELDAGRMPADAMVDGLLILIAGLVLVTPGILTDGIGFALLIAPLRTVVKRTLAAWIRRNFRVETVAFGTGVDPHRDGAPTTSADQIIDARVIHSHVEDVP